MIDWSRRNRAFDRGMRFWPAYVVAHVRPCESISHDSGFHFNQGRKTKGEGGEGASAGIESQGVFQQPSTVDAAFLGLALGRFGRGRLENQAFER